MLLLLLLLLLVLMLLHHSIACSALDITPPRDYLSHYQDWALQCVAQGDEVEARAALEQKAAVAAALSAARRRAEANSALARCV